MVDRYRTWEPRDRGTSIAAVIRTRADRLRKLVRRLEPDLLVADFMPAGPYGELVGALDELAAAGGRAVAGFRDIIDEPAFVRELWRETGVYEVLSNYYAAICVYGAPQVVDFQLDYGLDGELASKLQYIGYLGRRHAPLASASRIVASSGGGVDGATLLRAFILAVRAIGPRLRASRLVVGGPLLAERELISLQELADGAGIEVRRFASELDELVASSDLVVTMPGYNTTCELLSGAARAIVVPRSGPSLEQRMRASQLVQWGRATALDPRDLDPETLARAIEAAFSAPPPPPVEAPLDGIERAVGLFEALLAGERAPAVIG
jgi:predicted glycosyltransferase